MYARDIPSGSRGRLLIRERRKVLFLCNEDPEPNVLEEVLSQYAVVTCVRSIAEMLAVLGNGEYDALFCEWEFVNGTWRDALEELRKRECPLPMIVFYRSGGEREWLEVLDAGAFDFLAAPYGGCQVYAVLEHAILSKEPLALREAS